MSEIQKVEISPTVGESVDIKQPSAVTGEISSRTVIRVVLLILSVLGVLAASAAIIYFLREMLLLLILAVFFAYLISPLVDAVHAIFTFHGKPLLSRSLAIAVVYVAIGLFIYMTAVFLAPIVSDQISSFAEQLPTYSKTARDSINDVNNRFNRLPLPPATRKNIQESALGFLDSFAESAIEMASTALKEILLYIPWLILVPILAFFLLKDVKSFRLGILRALPAGIWRNRIEELLHDTNMTMAAYARAQIISCVLIGVISNLGFYFLNVPYPILFGVLAGIFEFVPLIGPLTLATIVTVVSGFSSMGTALSVVGFLGVLRIIHDYITYPRIIRQGIHLHPLAIILAVLAGEQLAGITGVFLSIPLVAIGTVIFKHISKHHKTMVLEKSVTEIEGEQHTITTIEEVKKVG